MSEWVMQGDGNLVGYRSDGTLAFNAETYDHPGSSLVAQDDGNFVVYGPDGTPLWSLLTGTIRAFARGGYFLLGSERQLIIDNGLQFQLEYVLGRLTGGTYERSAFNHANVYFADGKGNYWVVKGGPPKNSSWAILGEQRGNSLANNLQFRGMLKVTDEGACEIGFYPVANWNCTPVR
jgi:hypothetical protein